MEARLVSSAKEIGKRAALLRTSLGLTSEEAASLASISTSDLHRFERDGEATVETLIKLLRALSNDGTVDQWFTTPHFESIDDVIAFERRRRAAH